MSAGRSVRISGLVLLLALALIALLAAACGGDSGTGDTPAAGDTPSAGETPSEGETPSGGGDGEGLRDLEALAAEAAEGVVAKVTYEFQSTTGGQEVKGEWLIVQRPPDSRFEFFTDEGGAEFRTIVIRSGNTSYLCFSGGGEETCLATEVDTADAETALFDPLFNIPREIAEDIEGVNIVDRSERTIAGVDATCFSVSSALVDLGDGEMCFSDDGILLLLRARPDGDGITLEATSVTTDVKDADFDPPYEIFEFPDFELPTP